MTKGDRFYLTRVALFAFADEVGVSRAWPRFQDRPERSIGVDRDRQRIQLVGRSRPESTS